MDFSRRSLLRAAAPLVIFTAAGCMNTGGDQDNEAALGGTRVDEPTQGSDGTNDPAEISNPWVSQEGVLLVSLTVDEGFSEQVVLQSTCRTENVTVAPGSSVEINREADGEECFVRLLTDKELYSKFIRLDQTIELTVQESGDIKEQIRVK